jgi:hypothetical protein
MKAVALAALACLAACGSDDGKPIEPEPEPQSLAFGPLTIAAHSEDITKCVALTLHNDAPLYVNQVELTTGPGFHHSNWLYVPEHSFAGEDGIFTCEDRNYDQVAAGILGGVFFAQSTQSEHEVQTFPQGVVIEVPAHSKLVAQIHLLDTGDEDLALTPTIGFTPIRGTDVTTRLESMDFEYHPLGLPPGTQSAFTVECDIAAKHQELLGRVPDFKIYYALAHYHGWGTGLHIEAVRDNGDTATIYSTTNAIGDALGGTIEPAFDMTGYSKIRLTCDYYNDTAGTIYYGNGGGEMCVFNAFSDSPYTWAGGALDAGDPGTPTYEGDIAQFTRGCQVFAVGGS